MIFTQVPIVVDIAFREVDHAHRRQSMSCTRITRPELSQGYITRGGVFLGAYKTAAAFFNVEYISLVVSPKPTVAECNPHSTWYVLIIGLRLPSLRQISLSGLNWWRWTTMSHVTKQLSSRSSIIMADTVIKRDWLTAILIPEIQYCLFFAEGNNSLSFISVTEKHLAWKVIFIRILILIPVLIFLVLVNDVVLFRSRTRRLPKTHRRVAFSPQDERLWLCKLTSHYHNVFSFSLYLPFAWSIIQRTGHFLMLDLERKPISNPAAVDSYTARVPSVPHDILQEGFSPWDGDHTNPSNIVAVLPFKSSTYCMKYSTRHPHNCSLNRSSWILSKH